MKKINKVMLTALAIFSFVGVGNTFSSEKKMGNELNQSAVVNFDGEEDDDLTKETGQQPNPMKIFAVQRGLPLREASTSRLDLSPEGNWTSNGCSSSSSDRLTPEMALYAAIDSMDTALVREILDVRTPVGDASSSPFLCTSPQPENDPAQLLKSAFEIKNSKQETLWESAVNSSQLEKLNMIIEMTVFYCGQEAVFYYVNHKKTLIQLARSRSKLENGQSVLKTLERWNIDLQTLAPWQIAIINKFAGNISSPRRRIVSFVGV